MRKPTNWPEGVPYIDTSVRHVGPTILRTMAGADLAALGDTVYVIQVNEKPVAVICSYEVFMGRDGHPQ